MDAAAQPRRRKRDTLTVSQRILSASTGGLITSFLMTPLDVVKVRLQAQAAAQSARRSLSAAQCLANESVAANPAACQHVRLSDGLLDYVCTHKSCRSFSAADAIAPQRVQLNGTVDAVLKLARHEGVLSLWTGLPPTLLMSLPATVLYFTAYDSLKESVGRQPLLAPVQALGLEPLVAGGWARVVAASCVSPLELVRTQMQGDARAAQRGLWAQIAHNVKHWGVTSLWRGLSATLWRDVPFSAMYWLVYERAKGAMLQGSGLSRATMQIDFGAGATAGAIAAVLTTPFDVVKTRRQIEMSLEASGGGRVAATRLTATHAVIGDIVRAEGVLGLFEGLGPRVAKVAPACAVMITSYEAGKRIFLED